jgi:hypothetical protein
MNRRRSGICGCNEWTFQGFSSIFQGKKGNIEVLSGLPHTYNLYCFRGRCTEARGQMELLENVGVLSEGPQKKATNNC